MSISPTLLVSHGATIFTAANGDPTHDWLASLATHVVSARTRAIVAVSAHHVSAGDWVVASGERHHVIHDHPVTALYGEQYSPPGDPALASRIVDIMGTQRLSARTDPHRGLDHGVWLPLRAMIPRADVPVVMVSVNARASFEEHVAAGRALEPLRREGVLVLASGGVTHNQEEFHRRFPSRKNPALDPPAWSIGYDAWVASTLSEVDPRARLTALSSYERHQDYSSAHPTPEHFWPVLVATGAAGTDVGRRVHQSFQLGLSTSAFMFGEF